MTMAMPMPMSTRARPMLNDTMSSMPKGMRLTATATSKMATKTDSSDLRLRRALEASGQRFTEQRAAVYRYLAHTDVHPTADEVLLAVREELPGISLATVYKSLETLVGCGLAVKLTYGDGSARSAVNTAGSIAGAGSSSSPQYSS